MNKVWQNIRMSKFLTEYCGIEYNTTTKHKMRGKDGNGKPIEFSETEKKKIEKGLANLVKDLMKSLKIF